MLGLRGDARELPAETAPIADPILLGRGAAEGREISEDPEALLSRKPGDVDEATGLAYDLYRQGRVLLFRAEWQDALRHFTRGLELDPISAHLWYLRGVALHDLGALEDAVADLDQAVEVELGLVIAYDRGNLSLHQRRVPKTGLIRLYRVFSLAAVGATERAIADLDWILDEERRRTVDMRLILAAYLTRGLVRERRGEIQAALNDYKTMKRVEEDHAKAKGSDAGAFAQSPWSAARVGLDQALKGSEAAGREVLQSVLDAPRPSPFFPSRLLRARFDELSAD